MWYFVGCWCMKHLHKIKKRQSASWMTTNKWNKEQYEAEEGRIWIWKQGRGIRARIHSHPLWSEPSSDLLEKWIRGQVIWARIALKKASDIAWRTCEESAEGTDPSSDHCFTPQIQASDLPLSSAICRTTCAHFTFTFWLIFHTKFRPKADRPLVHLKKQYVKI